VLAVVFLVVLLVPYSFHLDRVEADAVNTANVVIWLAFAVDYFARLYLALDRKAYVRRNILDLLIVVVPFLRPIRAVRLLRLVRLFGVAGVAQRRAASVQARTVSYVVTTAVVATLVASFAVYDVERRAKAANIKSMGDALWWSMTTIFTVGYGDRYPTTTAGRFIAVGLMAVGIALLGVVTAAIAAWFVGQLRRLEETEAHTEVTLEAVMSEVQRLHARLDALDGTQIP
jgi:voltage-gated potassium channel